MGPVEVTQPAPRQTVLARRFARSARLGWNTDVVYQQSPSIETGRRASVASANDRQGPVIKVITSPLEAVSGSWRDLESIAQAAVNQCPAMSLAEGTGLRAAAVGIVPAIGR
jgi:hypothetical protein